MKQTTRGITSMLKALLVLGLVAGLPLLINTLGKATDMTTSYKLQETMQRHADSATLLSVTAGKIEDFAGWGAGNPINGASPGGGGTWSRVLSAGATFNEASEKGDFDNSGGAGASTATMDFTTPSPDIPGSSVDHVVSFDFNYTSNFAFSIGDATVAQCVYLIIQNFDLYYYKSGILTALTTADLCPASTDHHISIVCTGADSFHVELNGNRYPAGGELENNGEFTGVIDRFYIRGAAAGTGDVLLDNIQSSWIGTTTAASGYGWEIIDPSAMISIVADDGIAGDTTIWGYFTCTGNSPGIAKYTYPMPSNATPANSAPVGVPFNINAPALGMMFLVGDAAGIKVRLVVDTSGNVKNWKADGTTTTIASAAIAVDTSYKITVWCRESTYWIDINGTIYNNSGSYYATQSSFSGVLTWWGIARNAQSGTSNTPQVYFKDLALVEANSGLYFDTWIDVHEENDLTACSTDEGAYDLEAIEQSDGSILVPAIPDDDQANYGALYRVTGSDFSTWTEVYRPSDIGYYFRWRPINMGSGTLYANLYRDGVTHYMLKSTDYGENWAAMGSVGSYVVGLFNISTDVYLVAFSVVDTELRVYKLTSESPPTWTEQAALAYTPAVFTASNMPIPIWMSGDLMYFIINDNDVACLFVYDDGAGTITKISTIDAGNSAALHIAHCTVINDEITFDDAAGTGIAYVTLIVGANYRLYRTADGGNTWTTYNETLNVIGEAPRHFLADSKTYVLDIQEGSGAAAIIYEYDHIHDHFIRLCDLATRIGNLNELWNVNPFYPTSSGAIIFPYFDTVLSSFVDIHVFTRSNVVRLMSECTIQAGIDSVSSINILTHPVNMIYFNEGDVLRLYDAFAVLVGLFKLENPIFIPNQGWRITGRHIVNADYTQSPSPQTFSSSATDTILNSLIDDMKWAFRSSSIDPNGDFTTTYTRSVRGTFLDFVNDWAREFEHALCYHEPDGLIRCHKYTRAIATGLEFCHYHPSNDLQNQFSPDQRITRSRVMGARAMGSSAPVEVYIDYVGDAVMEVTNGQVAISIHDPQVLNYDEALQLATNRYNIYGTPARFVCLRVAGLGYLQPGETVGFHWIDTRNGITIPYDDYYIVAWEYDARHDRYDKLWLANTIVTPEEFNLVMNAAARDTTVQAAYVSADTALASSATAIPPLPLNRLAMGHLFVWRLSEPTAVDFDKTALAAIGSVAGTWYDLDLSSIVPTEAKAVLVRVLYEDNVVASRFSLRENGQTSTYQQSRISTGFPGTEDDRLMIVGLDTTWKCEFMSSITVTKWTTLSLVVLGWWI